MAIIGRLLVPLGVLLLVFTVTAVSAGDYNDDNDYGDYGNYAVSYNHSPKEEHSYAYYLNHKLYDAFSHYFPSVVYPYLQCVEALDAHTNEPYDYDKMGDANGKDDNDEYGGYKKPSIVWRAHFGYYSSYKKPYKVCYKCSKGISYDGKKKDFDFEKAPREFVSGYSTHFPNSAFHIDFSDHKNSYASWKVKNMTAIATRESQRCPVYKYSRMVYGHSPDIDVKYLKFAYSLRGPWVDDKTTSWDSYGSGGNAKSRDSGYTYFGQFVDHDITKDTVPGSEMDELYNSDTKVYIRKPDWYTWPPNKITNGRTPLLDLDSVYGKYGRDLQYRDKEDYDKLEEGKGNDVPRDKDGKALIPEGRNDDNIVVVQFHYIFIEFHNAVVDWIREHDYKQGCKESIAVFERAKKIVTWHYQWLVLNTFLPHIVDHDILDHIHRYGRRHWTGLDAQKLNIPIEFSAAAYRFHSIVRDGYKINNKVGFKKLFDPSSMDGKNDMRGGKHLQKNGLEADWRLFFNWEDEEVKATPGRLIDEDLAPSLLNLPIPPAHAWIVDKAPLSLPVRAVLRGAMYGVASGEEIAEAFNVRKLKPYQVDWYVKGYYRKDGKYDDYLWEKKAYVDDFDYDEVYKYYDGTPLWYYIQREAMVHNKGERLGYVGSLIVAETLIGLLQADPDSYLNAAPGFRPFLYDRYSENGRRCEYGHKCYYNFQELLDFLDLRKPSSEKDGDDKDDKYYGKDHDYGKYDDYGKDHGKDYDKDYDKDYYGKDSYDKKHRYDYDDDYSHEYGKKHGKDYESKPKDHDKGYEKDEPKPKDYDKGKPSKDYGKDLKEDGKEYKKRV